MRKLVSRVLVFAMLANVGFPAVGAAQQRSEASAKVATEKPSGDQLPVASAMPKLPKFWDWKEIGVDPLIPPSLLPADYGKNSEKDLETIQKIVLGLPGWEVQYKQFWAAARMVFFLGEPMDPDFERQLKDVFRLQIGIDEFHAAEGTWFQGPMASGFKNVDGKVEAKLLGPAHIMIPGGVDTFTFGPIKIKSGPFANSPAVFVVIPKICINLTFNFMSAEANDTIPGDKTTGKMVKIEIDKVWKTVDGKKAKTPSRQDLQLSFTATPTEAGDVVRAEAFDNQNAELVLEVGKTYTIDESVASSNWRRLTDPVKITVGEKNDKLVFENIQVLSRANLLAAAPATVKEVHTKEVIREGGVPWKKIIVGGLIGGAVVGALCTKYCGKEDTTVRNNVILIEPVKGTTNNGGSPK